MKLLFLFYSLKEFRNLEHCAHECFAVYCGVAYVVARAAGEKVWKAIITVYKKYFTFGNNSS